MARVIYSRKEEVKREEPQKQESKKEEMKKEEKNLIHLLRNRKESFMRLKQFFLLLYSPQSW
jgi:hypothetical protein